MKKILINTPNLKGRGGVINHYVGLNSFWSNRIFYNYIGSRKEISGYIIIWFDLLKFICKILFNNYDLIVLNPSLYPKALYRDSIYLKLAKLFNYKVIVFFHGWSQEYADKIEKQPKLFIKKYEKSDAIIVLYTEFAKQLKSWGYKSKIFLSTTKVDDNLLKNFDYSKKEINTKQLLFLSRIEKEKGIFITLEAFKILEKKYTDVNLIVAGDGSALTEAKLKAQKLDIKNVTFLGNVSGKKLVEAFSENTVYIFPTYAEGMPTSVLEAMAFGQIIVSRKVGGLNDFFEDNKMGYLIESKQPEDFVLILEKLLKNKTLSKDISQYNYDYSKNHFRASMVAKKLEKIFLQIINN